MHEERSLGPVGFSGPHSLDRRAFLACAAFGVLAGCASSERHAALPHGDLAASTAPPPTPKPLPHPVAPVAPSDSPFPGVRPRSAWAKGPPELDLMNPMLPVRYVTVHHDGLDRLEEGFSPDEMAARIELYRVGHRAKGWGDIGYHFVIDRTGVVWQARSLQWQGAHVKDRNEGNVGILVMGNFEIQQPTPQQMQALRSHLHAVCAYYSVPWTRVFSHREWPGAQTLCPGRNLQVAFVQLRQTERTSA